MQILSFVAFPDAKKLKISGTDSVGYARDIVRKIKDYRTQIFTDTERDEIFDILVNANIQDKKERKLHNKGVKSLKYDKLANKENEVIENKENSKCPKCGGDLIEKSGKYGKFLGCSNYPKCRHTQNI